MSTAPPFPTAPEQQPVVPPKNGLGTAGFVVGLIGFVLSLIPLVGIVAWPLVIVGLILSIMGLLRVNKRLANNKGMTIAGIVLSALGLIACILYTIFTVLLVSAAAEQQVSFPASSGDSHTVEYTVTAPNGASVIYGGGLTVKQATSQAGATFAEKGSFSSAQLDLHIVATATSADTTGQIGCKIVVDGKTVDEKADAIAASCEYHFAG